MTVVSHSLLVTADDQDILTGRWRTGLSVVPEDSPAGIAGLARFVAHAAAIRRWAVSSVLFGSMATERAFAVIRLVDAAHECMELKNASDAGEIILGLSSPAVARLGETWAAVPAETRQRFVELRRLFQPEGDFANYRALVSHSAVAVPLVRPLLCAMDAAVGTADFVPGTKLVNHARFMTVAEVIVALVEPARSELIMDMYEERLAGFFNQLGLAPGPELLTDEVAMQASAEHERIPPASVLPQLSGALTAAPPFRFPSEVPIPAAAGEASPAGPSAARVVSPSPSSTASKGQSPGPATSSNRVVISPSPSNGGSQRLLPPPPATAPPPPTVSASVNTVGGPASAAAVGSSPTTVLSAGRAVPSPGQVPAVVSAPDATAASRSNGSVSSSPSASLATTILPATPSAVSVMRSPATNGTNGSTSQSNAGSAAGVSAQSGKSSTGVPVGRPTQWVFKYPSDYAFSEADGPTTVVVDGKTGTRPTAATMTKLIEYLCSTSGCKDDDMRHVFLGAYRAYTTAHGLLRLLASFFLHCEPENASTASEMDVFHQTYLVPLRLRILDFLGQWMRLYPDDFQAGGRDFLETLATFLFVEDCDNDALDAATERIKVLVQETQRRSRRGMVAADMTALARAPAVRLVPGHHETDPVTGVLDMDSHEAARQMALVDWRAFATVDLHLLFPKFSSRAELERQLLDALLPLSRRSMSYVEWASESVVRADDASDRVRVIHHLIDIAHHAAELDDWTACAGIVGGLKSPASQMMSSSWARVREDKKALLSSLQERVRAVDALAGKSSLASVPYAEAAHSRLEAALESSPFLPGSTRLLSVERMQAIAAVFVPLWSGQQSPYVFREHIMGRQYLERIGATMNSEDLMQLARSLEGDLAESEQKLSTLNDAESRLRRTRHGTGRFNRETLRRARDGSAGDDGSMQQSRANAQGEDAGSVSRELGESRDGNSASVAVTSGAMSATNLKTADPSTGAESGGQTVGAVLSEHESTLRRDRPGTKRFSRELPPRDLPTHVPSRPADTGLLSAPPSVPELSVIGTETSVEVPALEETSTVSTADVAVVEVLPEESPVQELSAAVSSSTEEVEANFVGNAAAIEALVVKEGESSAAANAADASPHSEETIARSDSEKTIAAETHAVPATGGASSGELIQSEASASAQELVEQLRGNPALLAEVRELLFGDVLRRLAALESVVF
jgi:hypothetical protein